jgi:cytochrome P450
VSVQFEIDPEEILRQINAPEGVADPHPLYEQLRKTAPVYRGPGTGGLWFLSKWANCNDLLRSRAFGNGPGAPLLRNNPCFQKSAALQRFPDFIMFKDPPVHTRLRSWAVQVFTPRLGNKIAPVIGSLVDDALRDLEGRSEFEFIADFAFKLPGAVMGRLLGVPPEDQKHIDGWIRTQALGLGPGMREDLIPSVDRATVDLQNYLLDLCRVREKAPGDDMLSQLIQTQPPMPANEPSNAETTKEQDLTAMLNVLISAGTETTQNLLGTALYALLRAPDQMRLLQNSTEYDRSCVEEFIRFDGPALISNVRFAFEDYEFSGVQIKAGDPVVAVLAAGNRDPDKFSEPNSLDIRRQPNPHLGFAAGIHACLGAPLARAETAAAIPQLVRRFPRLSLIEAPAFTVGAGAFMRVAIN